LNSAASLFCSKCGVALSLELEMNMPSPEEVAKQQKQIEEMAAKLEDLNKRMEKIVEKIGAKVA
jgi:uncharacterized coiled-coil protein SlyX